MEQGPAATALERALADPDSKLPALEAAVWSAMQEQAEALIDQGRDGLAYVECYLAALRREISLEDYQALLDEIFKGSFKAEQLERRQLLHLARTALESRG
jgi:alkylhydroperoxidase family enzyme